MYLDLIKAGYTSVCEFHYLHHVGSAPLAASQALIDAAATSGIALTLLPTLYERAGFDQQGPTDQQRKFVLNIDEFMRLVAELGSISEKSSQLEIGIAFHSLRAVSPVSMKSVLDSIPQAVPIHIHIAEQLAEIESCKRHLGTTPIRWLLDNADVTARWCLIHATHATPEEASAISTSGACVCLCPTTEGDLGDGLFSAKSFLAGDGRFGIGGDSHVNVDPFLELRLFEYGQRMKYEQRNVFRLARAESFGGRLYRAACGGGAQASGQRIGAIAAGHRADWIVLDQADAIGQHGDALLDSAIFGPLRAPIGDVMVGGRWHVRDGVHPRHAEIAARYAITLRRLLT